METFIHADIFFFITSIAVILLTAALVALLIYLIRILRDLKKISAKVKDETELVAGDIDDLRRKTKEEGYRLKNFISFFSGLGKSRKKKKK